MSKLARWALLAAPLLVAAALFFAVWSSWRGAKTASGLVARGEQATLCEAVAGDLGELAGRPTSTDLQALVDARASEGLRWVAITDGRRVVLEGGRAGGRTPVVCRARRRGPRLMLVLEPHAAAELESSARATLAIGTIAAGAFLAIALLLVRWLLGREAAARRLEQEKRLASLGQMSATLAHELRNPLASLKGNAQLLARALPEGDKPRAKADLVVSEAVRLERLLDDLLEFAKTGAIHRADADPRALLAEVAAAAPERIDVDAAGAPASFPLDAERMRQALRNLVDNALQAGDGRVRLSARADGGTLVLAVADRGPGLTAEDVERLFEPFYTKKTRGTGLGLAVARRFVELHGGTLTAATAPEGGAVFTIVLPSVLPR